MAAKSHVDGGDARHQKGCIKDWPAEQDIERLPHGEQIDADVADQIDEQQPGADFARKVSTWLLLIYLIGYVGINLFTMGQALNILLGWPVFYAALLVASISAVYVTFGGQTSVIMTDLFQGAMLLATGLVLLILGIDHLGGFDQFWQHLPR